MSPMDDDERDRLLTDTHQRVQAMHQLLFGLEDQPGLVAVIHDNVDRVDVLEKHAEREKGLIMGIGLVWTAITSGLTLWFTRKGN